MRIANPIYDTVFKYLLDDEKVAKLMLSALLGREVLELTFRPTERAHPAHKPDGTQILVYRMDFSATLMLEDRRRTELEQLLAVFDQGLAAHPNPHLLDIPEKSFPERYREVLHQLLRAGADTDVLEEMNIEDDILKEFQDHARESADLRLELLEKDRILEEKERALVERGKALEERARNMGERQLGRDR